MRFFRFLGRMSMYTAAGVFVIVCLVLGYVAAIGSTHG